METSYLQPLISSALTHKGRRRTQKFPTDDVAPKKFVQVHTSRINLIRVKAQQSYYNITRHDTIIRDLKTPTPGRLPEVNLLNRACAEEL